MVLLSVGFHQYKRICVLFLAKERQLGKKLDDVLFQGTSINCTTASWSPSKDKTCHFQNLCYSHTDDFYVFVHSPNSEQVLISADSITTEPQLPLTSVTDSTYYFKCVNVTNEMVRKDVMDDNFIFMKGSHIVYTRFVPNNIFHVFHDELLPIYFTLRRYTNPKDYNSTRLFLYDNSDGGSFSFLHDLFSYLPPVFKYELALEPPKTLTCFEKATVGLVRESIWYQYGVNKPEGPIENSTVTSEHIRNFTTFVKERLGISDTCPKENFGILLSRKINRRLLNEKEFRSAISDQLQFDMVELSLESNSLSYIMEKVSCARLVVGVHGALLITTMFLQPSSVLLEIFPYAINPDHRTHYKTLVQLPGMGITYLSWRNTDKLKAVTHPSAIPRLGGIIHLPAKEQERIMSVTEVAHNKTGKDPEWRFFLYQDTIVDIPGIIDLLSKLYLKKQ
ncbi:Protein O-linked-mannose beta-1,4-N-acetylglucosaminyltransferase 2 [Holothuria leucospilota]|uniref:Protein O-linked-mannose beta-1,4-N-acetylglucosaminyltransferase 2 n=1 Tax=Holothuria leucospilota TaxID=206669 RepID=A0A9Q1C140_HOLLE|nr:Protein O-linked-mannose beta-1,4-N-acetylglucosaminyltransferase 2 [Holothuria leucospilota]